MVLCRGEGETVARMRARTREAEDDAGAVREEVADAWCNNGRVCVVYV